MVPRIFWRPASIGSSEEAARVSVLDRLGCTPRAHDPAHDRDRGPANSFAPRPHGEFRGGSNHLEALQTGVAIASDDQMIVHDNAEGLGDVYDLMRHANVGGRGRWIAGGVVMRQATLVPIALMLLLFFEWPFLLGPEIGGGES